VDMNKMLKRLINENIELIIETENNLWQVKTDPGQIEQILMNLVVNARDSMPAGGKLMIRTENAVVEQRDGRSGAKSDPIEYVMLIVSDNGSGIPDEIKPHIFEPFFTTKGQGKGTGLGLSTVYGIVEQNNGFIELDSQRGIGTTFKIYLQHYVGDLDGSRMLELEKNDLVGNETILVVEDEEIVRNLTMRLLIDLGYEAIVASDPFQAIELCKQRGNEIKLLLTDMIMPRMSGDELAVKVKELVPSIKIVFMSGYTDSTFIQHEILESQADFIQKPFKKAILGMKLREVLDRQLPETIGHV